MKNFGSFSRLLLLVIPFGFWLVMPQLSSPVLAQAQNQAESAVYNALQHSPAVIPRITKMTLQGNYGLVNWIMGEAGGMAILSKSGDNWEVVASGGGAFNQMDLVQKAGMGQNTAIRLWNTHNAAPSHDIASYCNSDEVTFVAAETQNYWVSICGQGSQPSFYVGVEKRNEVNRVRLPLTDFRPEGPQFEATRGNITYLLGWSAKGATLTVTQNSNELLREGVLGGLGVPNY